MKISSIALLSTTTIIGSADAAINLRELVAKLTGHDDADNNDADNANNNNDEDADFEAAIASLNNNDENNNNRDLQSNQNNCWGKEPPARWHPVYSVGWTDGYCRLTVDCNSPGYASELACCKTAYAGQLSGQCLSQLPNPPTTSPTDAGGLDVYYPDYTKAWPEGYCINDRDMPSGRPTYSTMFACCKLAYGGQVSGKCISMLPTPPTTSPTNEGGLADFWYPDYDTAWTEAGCKNTLPLPYNNLNDRPNYATQVACCKGAYAGQVSGACLSELESPPTTSPTMEGGIVDFWYPDYDTAWTEAGCKNTLPLPFKCWPSGTCDRPSYDSQESCCKGAYAGQVSTACMNEIYAATNTTLPNQGKYYPDQGQGWSARTCTDTYPHPIYVTEGILYDTEEACCKGSIVGQTTDACMCQVDSCYSCKCDGASVYGSTDNTTCPNLNCS